MKQTSKTFSPYEIDCLREKIKAVKRISKKPVLLRLLFEVPKKQKHYIIVSRSLSYSNEGKMQILIFNLHKSAEKETAFVFDQVKTMLETSLVYF